MMVANTFSNSDRAVAAFSSSPSLSPVLPSSCVSFSPWRLSDGTRNAKIALQTRSNMCNENGNAPINTAGSAPMLNIQSGQSGGKSKSTAKGTTAATQISNGKSTAYTQANVTTFRGSGGGGSLVAVERRVASDVVAVECQITNCPTDINAHHIDGANGLKTGARAMWIKRQGQPAPSGAIL